MEEQAADAKGVNPKAVARAKAFLVGLGLIGGSLGMALRASGRYVVEGFDIDGCVRDRALALGAIDRGAASIGEAAAADLVIVATPLLAMPSVFSELGHGLRLKGARSPGPVVTDVGSAKGYVLALAQRCLAPRVPFVGGHPMAGSEKNGVEHASPGLMRGCRYILTPAGWTADAHVTAVMEACEATGAIPQVMDPDEHDAMVAATSHVPLIVAACLAQVAGKRSAAHPSIWDLAASGFRDTTRVASGDPEMGAGMLVANAASILEALDEFQRELDEIRRRIAMALPGLDPSGAEAVRESLVQARASRQAWLDRGRPASLVTAHEPKESTWRRSGGARAWTSPMH